MLMVQTLKQKQQSRLKVFVLSHWLDGGAICSGGEETGENRLWGEKSIVLSSVNYTPESCSVIF